MSRSLPAQSWLRRPALWIGVLAFAWQAAVLGRFSTALNFLPNSDDMRFYSDWAHRIAGGQWSDGQAFYGLPGYAYFLAAIYKVAGFDPFLVGLLQAAVMGGMAATIWSLAQEVFTDSGAETTLSRWRPRVIGGIAVAGWLFFQPAQALAAVLMPTSWVVFAYWGVLLWILRTRVHSLWWPWLPMGVLIGFMAMWVATVFFLVPLAIARGWQLLAVQPQWRHRLLPVAAGAAMLIAGVFIGTSPAWLHNRFAARDPVFLSAHSGLNYYIGNNPIANGYPNMPPGMRASQAGMLRDSITFAETAVGRPLKRSEVSQYWTEQAQAWISAHRDLWIRLLALKIQRFWNAYAYDDLGLLGMLQLEGVLWPGLRFGAVAVWGLAGLVLVWPWVRARWVAAAVLFHMCALLPVFCTERYRLAAVPGLLLLAGLALWQGWRWLSLGQWGRITGWAALVASAAWFVSIPPANGDAWWLDNYNVGARLLDAADRDTGEPGPAQAAQREKILGRAQVALETALRWAPDSAETHFALGNLWYARGDRARAKGAYREALKLNPRHPELLNNLGVLAADEGFHAEAVRLFQATLARRPEDAKTWYLLALSQKQIGAIEAAKAAVDEAVKREPERREFQELQTALK